MVGEIETEREIDREELSRPSVPQFQFRLRFQVFGFNKRGK